MKRKDGDLVLKGALTAVVTPLHQDGTIDLAIFEQFLKWQIDSGIHGIVPCGTTGEGATLRPEEHAAVIETAVRVASGRVPVVAGCGTNDTRTTIAGAERAARAGADALLVVTPYYNKPNRSGMLAHFAAVAGATDLPVVAYNVPGRTGQNIGVELTMALAEIPGVIGVKEASGSLEQLAAVVERAGRNFTVLTGDDPLALPAIAIGAAGVISVVSNEAPGMMAGMMDAAERGDYAAARAIHYRLLPLMRANFVESNPVPVKTALARLNRCGETLRLPLGPPDDATRRAVDDGLRRAGLLPESA